METLAKTAGAKELSVPESNWPGRIMARFWWVRDFKVAENLETKMQRQRRKRNPNLVGDAPTGTP
jgi:hypothetical protein